MPILKDIDTKEIVLPESKAKVIILTKITFGSIIKIGTKNVEDAETQLDLAVSMISDWDFIDEKKEKKPITVENIKRLSPNDGNFLITEISALITEKKN